MTRESVFAYFHSSKKECVLLLGHVFLLGHIWYVFAAQLNYYYLTEGQSDTWLHGEMMCVRLWSDIKDLSSTDFNCPVGNGKYRAFNIQWLVIQATNMIYAFSTDSEPVHRKYSMHLFIKYQNLVPIWEEIVQENAQNLNLYDSHIHMYDFRPQI